MLSKRLLDDREELDGDRLLVAQGRSYTFAEDSDGDLVVTAEDERPTRFKPEALGC